MPEWVAVCKRRLRVRVEWPGASAVVDGWLHPRGCLGARYTHLDLEPAGPLRELASRRGINLRCINLGSDIELVEERTGIWVRVRLLGGARLKCLGQRVHVMTTRRGLVYIAPIEAKYKVS